MGLFKYCRGRFWQIDQQVNSWGCLRKMGRQDLPRVQRPDPGHMASLTTSCLVSTMLTSTLKLQLHSRGTSTSSCGRSCLLGSMRAPAAMCFSVCFGLEFSSAFRQLGAIIRQRNAFLHLSKTLVSHTGKLGTIGSPTGPSRDRCPTAMCGRHRPYLTAARDAFPGSRTRYITNHSGAVEY